MGPFVIAVDDLLHFLVDHLGRLLAEILVSGQFPAEEDEVVALAEGQRAQVGHAPLADHTAGDLRAFLEIVGRAGRRLVQEEDLGHPAGQQHGELGFQVVLAIGVAVVERQLDGHPQGDAAGNDGHLVDGIGFGDQGGDEGMAGLVEGRVLLLLVVDDHALPLDAHQDFILGVFEVLHGDRSLALTGADKSRLVDHVGQIGPAETRG